MRKNWIVGLGLLLLVLTACGDAADDVDASNNGTNNGTNNGVNNGNNGGNNGEPMDRQVGEPEEWTCGTVTHYAAGSYRHVPLDEPPTHISNPPCIGSHYGSWLPWGEYETQLDPGYFVHNLEHGGIVFLYNCPDGCEDEVAGLLEYVEGVPRDDGGAFRYSVGPYDPLPTRFAMAAWGVIWVGDSLCVEDMNRFRIENYRMAPEDVAAPGNGPHDPDED